MGPIRLTFKEGEIVRKLNTITELPLPKWERRLNAAEKRGKFTLYERELSNEWGTCAIGETYDVVDGELEEEYENANRWVEYDEKAERLGMQFMEAIEDQDVKNARETFNEIKKYALKMHKKYNVAKVK